MRGSRLRKDFYQANNADGPHEDSRSNLGTRSFYVRAQALICMLWVYSPLHRRKYNFKPPKKTAVGEVDDDDQEIEESVRTISALLTQSGHHEHIALSSGHPPPPGRVANISAEIAAAIAQTRSRTYGDVHEDDNEKSGSESGQEVGGRETQIGPNTSGIRGGGGTQGDETDDDEDGPVMGTGKDGPFRTGILQDDDDDEDAFPIPLRTRKGGRDSIAIVGSKRKR